MKGKLIKTGNDYLLKDTNGEVLAITNGVTEGKKLSKQNCDEIFGVVDVEKLAMGYDLYEKINFVGQTRAYIAGFNKAMELNKDKVFTLEDMGNLWDFCVYNKGTFAEFTQPILQPTEIDVEIEMEKTPVKMPGIMVFTKAPKLNSEGCLILKKI
jgi:hypothetical protein